MALASSQVNITSVPRGAGFISEVQMTKMDIEQDGKGNHTVTLDYGQQDNDSIFKSWRAEIGTDRETTRRLIESAAPPVIWPGERDWLWIGTKQSDRGGLG